MLKVVPTPEEAKEPEAAQERICKMLIKDSDDTLRRVSDIIESLKLSESEKSRYAEISSCAIVANVFSHLVAAARLTGVTRDQSVAYLAILADKACERAMKLADVTLSEKGRV